jgi:choice-of-anchor A domain-containing protein
MRKLAVPAIAAGAAALVALLAMPTSADVGPINPVAGGEGFLILVDDDTILGGDSADGGIAMGGDLTLAGAFEIRQPASGGFIAPGDSAPTSLLVGGQVDWPASSPSAVLRLLSSGYAKIADLSATFVRSTDNNNAAVNTRILNVNTNYDATPRIELTTTQSAASVGADPGLDVDGLFGDFRARSAQLATCPATVNLTDANGNPLTAPYAPGTQAYFTLEPGRTNVLNIRAEDLNALSVLTFRSQPTAATPLLINVDTTGVGGVYAWDSPNMAGIGGPQAQYVLFNFPDATSVQHMSGDSIQGTVYAPGATFIDTTSSNVQGNIVAREYQMLGVGVQPVPTAGGVTNFPFATTLQCLAATPSPSATSPSVSPSSSPSAPPSPPPSPPPSQGLVSPTPTAGEPTPTPSRLVPAPSGGTRIPVTGSAVGRTTLMGLLVLGAGLALIRVTRR